MTDFKTGGEPFRDGDERLAFSVRDFWSWAHSDLKVNTERGLLAEFLVARALGQDGKARLEWDVADVRHGDRLIEVKSAAYWQSWPQSKPSAIGFDIAPKKASWDARTNAVEAPSRPKRFAHAYVFCLLGSPDDEDPDPRDVGQWRFAVVATDVLDRRFNDQKTVAFGALWPVAREEGEVVGYGELGRAIESALAA